MNASSTNNNALMRWKAWFGLSAPGLVLCVLVGAALGTGTYTEHYA